MALLMLLLVLLLQERKGSTCTQRKGRKGNGVAGAGARGGVAEGGGGERDRSRNAHMQGRKALIAHMLLVVVLLLGGQNK